MHVESEGWPVFPASNCWSWSLSLDVSVPFIHCFVNFINASLCSYLLEKHPFCSICLSLMGSWSLTVSDCTAETFYLKSHLHFFFILCSRLLVKVLAVSWTSFKLSQDWSTCTSRYKILKTLSKTSKHIAKQYTSSEMDSQSPAVQTKIHQTHQQRYINRKQTADTAKPLQIIRKDITTQCPTGSTAVSISKDVCLVVQ